MNNFQDMLSKAKAMQEKMKEAQEKIKNIEVEGVAGWIHQTQIRTNAVGGSL